ncbi:hypothetical protein [Bacillus dakarensis]|uniref:hypothetical protein n=1 Tax=Robertmurraya dakarensis TaxID=1926278 RepID=UPI0012B697F0|nr:hypothetical protein [Bacillus dakarensis]
MRTERAPAQAGNGHHKRDENRKKSSREREAVFITEMRTEKGPAASGYRSS